MKVLVTGATGYLGRATLRALRAEGHRSIALVHRSCAGLPDDVEQRRGDVLEEISLHGAVKDVDAVVHLAAAAGIPSALRDPMWHYRLNLVGTLNVLAALKVESERTGRPTQLIFASSCSVYGTRTTQLISESLRLKPQNPYAASKKAAEEAIAWQSATGALGAISLRLFNLAGAAGGFGDPDYTRIVPRAAAAALGRIPKLSIYGDGSAVRDYVHVKDAAAAIALGLRGCQAGRHKIFNVGATPASITEIIMAMSYAAGREVPIEHHPCRPGDLLEVRADTSRVRKALGWSPTHSSLEEITSDQWCSELARATQ